MFRIYVGLRVGLWVGLCAWLYGYIRVLGRVTHRIMGRFTRRVMISVPNRLGSCSCRLARWGVLCHEYSLLCTMAKGLQAWRRGCGHDEGAPCGYGSVWSCRGGGHGDEQSVTIAACGHEGAVAMESSRSRRTTLNDDELPFLAIIRLRWLHRAGRQAKQYQIMESEINAGLFTIRAHSWSQCAEAACATAHNAAAPIMPVHRGLDLILLMHREFGPSGRCGTDLHAAWPSCSRWPPWSVQRPRRCEDHQHASSG